MISANTNPSPPDYYADAEVQEEAFDKLVGAWDVNGLVRSILTNGLIGFEYIVVKPYERVDDNEDDDEDDRYVVIEGNRRLAAINQIRRDLVRGRLTNEREREIAEQLKTIQVLVFSGTEAEEKIIHGIRHVAGPKEWKGYQQGQLVQDLRERLGMEFKDIQNALGLGPRVVQRVYQTLKAFEQMRKDEEYGDFADRGLFSLFQEMLVRPPLRAWLEWSEDQNKFLNDTNRKIIYRMIARDHDHDDNDDSLSQIIHNPPEMRTFARILAHPYRDRVLDRLLNAEINIEQAWATLEPGTVAWKS